MKKKLNKVMGLVLAGAMAFGFMAAQPEKAEAALGATYWYLDSSWGYSGRQASLHTNQDSYNIYAETNLPGGSQAYVKYSTQVKNSDGSWSTIETLNGGINTYSDNARVTFSNYSTAGTRTFRIRAMYYNLSNYTDHLQTVYSATWTR